MERNIDVNQCNPLISDVFFKNVQDLYHELPTNRNTNTSHSSLGDGRTFPKSSSFELEDHSC